MQAAHPLMVRQDFGHIVNTASMAGLVPNGYIGSYGATNHAAVGLSKALRIEAKECGVKVSALCLGLINTPIIEGGRYGRLKDDPLSEHLFTAVCPRGKLEVASFRRRPA